MAERHGIVAGLVVLKARLQVAGLSQRSAGLAADMVGLVLHWCGMGPFLAWLWHLNAANGMHGGAALSLVVVAGLLAVMSALYCGSALRRYM